MVMGDSSLLDALRCKNWARAGALLDGANAGELAREEDRNGSLPLHYALIHKAAPEVTLKVFAQHPDAARGKNSIGWLPLHVALERGAAPEVTLKIFAQHPDAAREKNSDGWLPLHVALEHKAAPEVVERVLAAYPEAAREKHSDGRLPLHIALASKAAPEVVERVLAVYPEAAREKGEHGMLPLHSALASKAAPEVVERVLAVYLEAAREKDQFGMLPLHSALASKAAPQLLNAVRVASGLGVVLQCGDWAAVEAGVVALTAETAREKDGEGRLPLYYALQYKAEPEMLCQLLRAHPGASGSLDLSCRGLDSLPPTLPTLNALTNLDLSGNSFDDPLQLAELMQLTGLQTLDLSGMPALRDLAELSSTQGAQAALAYVRDANDDPQRSYVLKLLLVGPTEAGKSSLLRALLGQDEASRLTRKDERTIGLDIERLVLSDPRAPGCGVTLLTYDAGGHDEYQNMHQSFLTRDSLYGMVSDVSRPRSDEPNPEAVTREMEAKLVRWATLVASCAPGATMVLIASHADLVTDQALLQRRCARMVACVKAELGKHRGAQQTELKRLRQSRQACSVETQLRIRQLEQALAQPMRLLPAERALPVSAKTLQGVDQLRQLLLDTAFDKDAFPRFGTVQPGTYGIILRQLRCAHEQPSLTWEQMTATLQAATPPHSATHRSAHVELLSIAASPKSDATQYNFRATGYEDWGASGALREWSVEYSEGLVMHRLLGEKATEGLQFPGKHLFGVDIPRRGEELRAYYEQLLRCHELPSLLPLLREVVQNPSMFSASEPNSRLWRCCSCEALHAAGRNNSAAKLLTQYKALPSKLQRDPRLLERALHYLRLTGEVLCHDNDLHHIKQRQRIFLRPQWLVDVMKEFVRHDFEERLASIDPSTVREEPALIRSLGTRFLTTGVLDRRLLPWIWRDLQPPVVDDQPQMDFLVDLLVQLGLLTRVPQDRGATLERTRSHTDSQWLLPMRLPKITLATLPSSFGDETATDEVGRRFEFHQPLPHGLVAVVISHCASICGRDTAIWRQALRTSMPGDARGKKVEVAFCQVGQTAIVCRGRTAKGRQHGQCFRCLEDFIEILEEVVLEHWPGCSWSVLCLSPRLGTSSVPLRECEHAVARGERTVTVKDVPVPLEELLAKRPPRFDPDVWTRLTQLRFLRDVAAAIGLVWAPKVKRFVVELDSCLDGHLGGTFSEGYRWSSRLAHTGLQVATLPKSEPEPEPEPEASTVSQIPSTDAQSVNALGQLAQSALLEVEEASVAGGSRALGLLRALGGLYEQTHELQPSAAFASSSEVYDHLLGPFPWLAATVRRLAKEHQISSLPALGQVFADDVHESVAPTGGPTQATFTHVPMVQRKYDFFINHCQTSGQDQCNTLSLLLKQKGAKVWYDMQAQDLTATGMEEGVSQSRNVLMFLSDDLMGRPFCQAEQRWGKLYGCNFVGIVEKDSRHSPADFGKEKERAPVDLKYLLDDVEFMPYRRRKYEAEAMLDELMRRGGVNVLVQAPEGIPP
eukprot:COSAG01_NODE_3831_length_5651_cov_4.363112_2_plen_1509_part_00